MGKNEELMKRFIKERYPYFYEWAIEVKSTIGYWRKKNTKPENYDTALEKIYYKKIGHTMNMANPRTYTEKIQWLKINDATELKSRLTDKVLVRDWIVEQLNSSRYLIPLIGVYSTFNEIDFTNLPGKFVMKTNHSSGWNIIVKDRDKLSYGAAKQKFKKWLSRDFAYWADFELHYSRIVPKILIEKYMEDKNGQLKDYKFLCFNGEVKYCWVDVNRFGNHKRGIYNTKWEVQAWQQACYQKHEGEKRPENFDEMLSIAQILCRGFLHVRVDLYNIDGAIYFGEMSFTNGGGWEKIYPENYDLELGKMVQLSKIV